MGFHDAGLEAELARFPMRFVAPVSFSDPSGTVDPMPPNNGTMTLLELPDGRVGVSCHHVIDAYREQRRLNASRVFKVGELPLDPLDRLIAEDPILDLAILDLHDVHSSRLALGGGEPEFFEPATWPLGTAEPGELIALGGWPSFYRREDSQRHTDFGVPPSGAFALGTTRVIDVGIENIVCEPSWDYWLEGEGPQRMDALVSRYQSVSASRGHGASVGSALELLAVACATPRRPALIPRRPDPLGGSRTSETEP